ncbi:hypothetical protein [Methylobacter sp. YRD-M1]|uniref:hypothetical protein n=1 Tax=Methylobacter sp. YRD-M1 TaxID=2911520 RepID=UPI00227BB3E5|nr:hypothetical protein [Methylobacter sp. YRD-M1]WAK01854.1 hypothetical protein LZ558_18875 [Methylobacter sp. YRD-M1]
MRTKQFSKWEYEGYNGNWYRYRTILATGKTQLQQHVLTRFYDIKQARALIKKLNTALAEAKAEA